MHDSGTHGERVKAGILAAGVKLWGAGAPVTAAAIGKVVRLSHSAVLYHFGSADDLRSAVAAEAVRVGDPAVIPMLIASRHPAAAALSSADRRRFLAGC